MLDRPGAVGQWRFTARKGERLVVEALARRHGSPLDPWVEVHDAQGQAVGKTSSIIGGPILSPTWVTLPPATYLGFSVFDHGMAVGGKGTLLAVQPAGNVWLLQPGAYTLHATFTAPKHKDAPNGAWTGQLELPPLKIVVK